MYIRPQLARKRTGDRDLLAREQHTDVFVHDATLHKGVEFENFSQQLSNVFEKLDTSDTPSSDGKAPILREIAQQPCELQKKYDAEIQNTLCDVEYSVQERICEMEYATR